MSPNVIDTVIEKAPVEAGEPKPEPSRATAKKLSAKAREQARKAAAKIKREARKAEAKLRAQARKAEGRLRTKAQNAHRRLRSELKAKAKARARRKKAPIKSIEGAWEPIDWRAYGPCVIGVDEVGRGCLAGPVYASAVLFTHDGLKVQLTDSKLLTEEERERLADRIREAHPVETAFATVEEIDELNILWASMLAMRRAVEQLEARLAGTEWAAHVGKAPIVVDGRMRIPDLAVERQIPLVKGDLRCAPVSAASIAAKVARDRHMKDQALAYPHYGFEKHKGYGTPVHQAALAAHGPCALHRRSFGTVKELLASVRVSDEAARKDVSGTDHP